MSRENDDRRRQLVSLLAEGLLRLRERSALVTENCSELSESSQNSLEDVLEIPLTVHDG